MRYLDSFIQDNNLYHLMKSFNSFSLLLEKKVCFKKICRGPLAHYNDLGCIAKYDEGDTCCPVRYNCNHLKDFWYKDMCHVRDKWYYPGDTILTESANLCESGCTCGTGENNM